MIFIYISRLLSRTIIKKNTRQPRQAGFEILPQFTTRIWNPIVIQQKLLTNNDWHFKDKHCLKSV